ncbi:MurR/RpiR family transcriptional regulator [Paenibacillus thiaminolyticus]|uniref:MurR/RpiR family transcriptional regulator n=1 Tax=Paenibacillus thiaminolyticus TaxID=49283 RepID=A0AAP9J4I5_PANTH|nr:MurR/RpiR family transcriptional regulator [Paenibacillus thiaminolyticus]MCY9537745.1 MurR/RpiR family transcriptional regulator [Paenibacillus thiaminolyticus]MCY9600302.1 MurR/RpiR family transcriptional regulator [Paenibacillus thiaminolyticus]MCY9607368.1 MurR/RpiR family transcriptional regulator [Paenibacillus thiaminolyticus]MCY9613889.1 MurR/RpiR family transcriptional regulator [Paenibacillus thiaminolyticus]MCY9617894.1 MurR/RpiR family transcriptional regulator [Paenibacillus th
MRNISILTRIHSMYNSFTNTERKVADYILEHTRSVIYMSITDLADACDVGESSIFRFCKSLTFKGYQEFKIALAHSITAENEIPQLTEQIGMDDTIEQVASKVLTTNVNAINETYDLLKADDIEKAIGYMIQAERIHFFGVGTSLITALEAKNKFMRITRKTECSFDSHLQMMSAALMTERDVAVMFSYSGSTKDTIEAAKKAKEKGAKIISITRFVKSPLTLHSDVTLLCGANEGPLQGGSLSAKIAQLYLLDVLYVEYFKRTYQESIDNKESTANAVIEKLL